MTDDRRNLQKSRAIVSSPCLRWAIAPSERCTQRAVAIPPALEQEPALCRKVNGGDVVALQDRTQTTPPPSQQELADHLCIAAGFRHTNCVHLLLYAVACPSTPSAVEECGQRRETRRSALHEACLWGCGAREQVVTLLMQSHTNVELTAKLQSKNMTAAHQGFCQLEQLIQAKRSDAEKGNAHAHS